VLCINFSLPHLNYISSQLHALYFMRFEFLTAVIIKLCLLHCDLT
jgi:hypothetical protein